jgi:pimeloyl-ACP methyl ester carboxylesterase
VSAIVDSLLKAGAGFFPGEVKLKRLFRGCKFVNLQGVFTIPGVGHAPHWERPEQVAAMVRAFVGERDEPAHVVFV